MQYSQNVIFRIGFDSVIEHNIFEILPANIEENHQFCRYWNATAAIQRISRAAHTKDRCCCSRWLQNGYRISKDATDSVKYMECMDEKRTISAYYHEKLRSGA